MFPIDVTMLPSLPTRKALLVVDAQNDFLAEDGVLPAKMPMDLPQRISHLANDFRRNGGEIIWVQSRFESPRSVDAEQIMILDTPSPSAGAAPARGRRSRTTPPAAAEPAVSPEAFLTPDPGRGPRCVRTGTLGAEMHPVVEQAVGTKDHTLTKTFYSAFKEDELLRLLRVRFVTELFICGSMINTGVMATAIDAASYGYTITIVDDCCGSQSMSRHRTALRQISTMTGCDTLSASSVLGVIRPRPTVPEQVGQNQRRDVAGGRSPTVRVQRGRKGAVAPSVSDIQPSLERLSLSGEAAAADEHASTISPSQQNRQRQQQGHQSQSQSQSQPQLRLQPRPLSQSKPKSKSQSQQQQQQQSHSPSSPAVQSMARSDYPQTKRKTDRDTKAESEPLCEGDTKVIYNILPEPLAQDIFERIQAEVSWQRMSHQGGEVPRLVAVQGCVEADGSKPVYRHPSDESPPLRPFTVAVNEIRRAVEAQLGHPLNHALIQLYRHGHDYISEHSDKTLDIARDSFIANVSLGAERTMTLRTKRRPKDSEESHGADSADNLKRQIQRARLPHNSLFKMGLATNMRWMHAIRQDKRLVAEKSDAERAYGGSRISLTFRHIATFLDADEAHIWGQGATAKTRSSARTVVNGQTDSAIAMLRAFGRENQASEFDWDDHYGSGFDVLHISTAPRLFLSEEDHVVNTRLQIMLGELGVSYARGSVSTAGDPKAKTKTATDTKDVPVKFVDHDESKTTLVGQKDIMMYLQKTYGNKLPDTERVRERFREGLEILNSWRVLSSYSSSPSTPPGEDEEATTVTELLAFWEEYAAEDAFIAGPMPSLADFAFWPVLRDILASPLFSSISPSPLSPSTSHSSSELEDEDEKPETLGKEAEREVDAAPPLPNLRAYHKRMLARNAVARVVG
ncbi:hypothetical protein GGR51DRAFT_547467 [Nemania sp. FL0031]|nr:hypothetical protein GGR51DRAFT_547467 [Nemania sp. FL0031]